MGATAGERRRNAGARPASIARMGPTTRTRSAGPWTRRVLAAEDVERVRARLVRLFEALHRALDDPGPAHDPATRRACVDAVIDAARWARLDVDGALAFKGHVAELRDADWLRLSPASHDEALAIFRRFLASRTTSWDLVAMRNLRARLEGLLVSARALTTA